MMRLFRRRRKRSAVREKDRHTGQNYPYSVTINELNPFAADKTLLHSAQNQNNHRKER